MFHVKCFHEHDRKGHFAEFTIPESDVVWDRIFTILYHISFYEYGYFVVYNEALGEYPIVMYFRDGMVKDTL